MHAWQPARLAAVLADMQRAGLSKSAIARIAGVHRSQVSRWFSGEQRPGYDPVMRIAGYLEQEHPDLAPAFAAAAGYAGPVEPEPEPLIPDSLMATIRRSLSPEEQEIAIEALERALRPKPSDGEEESSGQARRAG